MALVSKRKSIFNNVSKFSELKERSQALTVDVPQNKRLVKIRVDDITSREQVRKSFDQDELEALATSLKNEGQHTPITVSPRNADGKYVILMGERRWRAAKMAGLKKLDAVVDDREFSEDARKFAQLTENIQRDDMRPLDIAKAFTELAKSVSVTVIAERLGRSPQWVRSYLDLGGELPAWLVDLGTTSIKDVTTLNNLRKAAKLKPEETEAWVRAEMAENGSLTRKMSEAILRRASGREETNRPKPALQPVAKSEPVKPKHQPKPKLVDNEPDEDDEGNDEEVVDLGKSTEHDYVIDDLTQPFDEEELPVEDEEEEDDGEVGKEVENEDLPEGVRRCSDPKRIVVLVQVMDSDLNAKGHLTQGVVCDDPAFVCVTYEDGTIHKVAVGLVIVTGVEIR